MPKLGHKMQIRRIRLNDFDYLKRNSNNKHNSNKNNNNKNSNKSNNKQKKEGGWENPVKRREREKSLKIQINKAFLYFRRRCIQQRPFPLQPHHSFLLALIMMMMLFPSTVTMMMMIILASCFVFVCCICNGNAERRRRRRRRCMRNAF